MAKGGGPLNRVKKELVQLQERGAVVHTDLRRSHRSLYEHLASLYIWWRSARDINGYLEQEYATLNLKPRTIDGINFRPLLVLIWGFNATSSQQTALYSRALNAVHNEYEAHPELYAKDGVAKLANFIELAGGAIKLAGYGAQESDEDEAASGGTGQKWSKVELDLKARERLLADALAYTNAASLPAVEIERHVATEQDADYVLMLVKKTPDGFKFVGTSDHKNAINDIMIDQYRRRFDGQKSALRPILELLQTQCLPKHLENVEHALTAKGVYAEMWSRHLYASPRRVLYRHADGAFTLSPVGAASGVVSVIKPFQPILANCETDVYLGSAQRQQLESQCLRSFYFNLYDLGDDGQIPEYEGPNSASHILTLSHLTKDNVRLYLPFWPFYETMTETAAQIVPDPFHRIEEFWEAQISQDWVHKFNEQFLTPWLESHAKHLKRDINSVLHFTFEKSKIVVEFVRRDGGLYDNRLTMPFDEPVQAMGTLGARFAAIDIAPVLDSLALLPIAGPINIIADSEVMRLRFQTVDGGCSHEIFVPAIAPDGKRRTTPFFLYEPVRTPDQDVIADGDEAVPEPAL